MTENETLARKYLQVSTGQESETQYKFKTENRLSMSFPIIITEIVNASNAAAEEKIVRIVRIVRIVDYDKLFREQPDIRKNLHDILAKAENLNSLNDLSSDDQQTLFETVDKFDAEYLYKYGADVDVIGEDGIRELIDRDIVLINELRNDIVEDGMVNVLTK
jgi:hypothetical protein